MKHGTHPDGFERVIRWHVTRFPRLESGDLVKMAYQAAFGNHHFVNDPGQIRSRMETELESRHENHCSIYLIEPLSPDTKAGWVRVNLDVWQQAGGDLGRLADVVAASGGCRTDGRIRLGSLLQDLEAFLRREAVSLPGKAVSFWIKWLKANHFEPVHHSPAYVHAYHPAYRVVHFPLLSRHLPPGVKGKIPYPGGKR